jgi:hypothetical protein
VAKGFLVTAAGLADNRPAIAAKYENHAFLQKAAIDHLRPHKKSTPWAILECAMANALRTVGSVELTIRAPARSSDLDAVRSR